MSSDAKVYKGYRDIEMKREHDQKSSSTELLKEGDELKWKCDENKRQRLTRFCRKSHSR